MIQLKSICISGGLSCLLLIMTQKKIYIRSVIYDLVIDPDYQNKGIGTELVRRCIEHFPNTEWLVQIEKHISGYYEKIGFKIYNDVVLTIPSIYQRSV